MEMWVKALRKIEHYGTRRRGARFLVVKHFAEQLAARGLVEIEDHQPPVANPTGAAGTPSSASPADPASPQTTSTESGDGDSENPPAETEPDPKPVTTESGHGSRASSRRRRGSRKTGEG